MKRSYDRGCFQECIIKRGFHFAFPFSSKGKVASVQERKIESEALHCFPYEGVFPHVVVRMGWAGEARRAQIFPRSSRGRGETSANRRSRERDPEKYLESLSSAAAASCLTRTSLSTRPRISPRTSSRAALEVPYASFEVGAAARLRGGIFVCGCVRRVEGGQLWRGGPLPVRRRHQRVISRSSDQRLVRSHTHTTQHNGRPTDVGSGPAPAAAIVFLPVGREIGSCLRSTPTAHTREPKCLSLSSPRACSPSASLRRLFMFSAGMISRDLRAAPPPPPRPEL